jgi:ATP-dependent protease ClpP protease subunit
MYTKIVLGDYDDFCDECGSSEDGEESHSAPNMKIFIYEAPEDSEFETYHDYYLFGEITLTEDYIFLLNYLNNLSKRDMFRIYIDSDGGNVFAALAILRGLRLTKAHTHAIVTGQCSSSATMLFLGAKTYEIEPHCVFMFHNYSGKRFGKGGELYDNIVFERKWSEHLLTSMYEGFLSEEEITQILNNKDIWMSSEEVSERMKRLKRYNTAKRNGAILQPKDFEPMACSAINDIGRLELWVGDQYE